MNRPVLVLLLPLLAVGCVDLDVHRREKSTRPVTPLSAIATPITADQVTSTNARRMAQTLWDEFDREEQMTSATEKTKK